VNPSEILKRLEVDAVLLPIRRGTKSPNRKEWQKLSFADTQDPKFQRSLLNAPAIGVLLGSASGGLCSIDFDDDEFLQRFLEVNPKLEGTLRTTARRGANLWIVLEDTPPPSGNLVFEGAAVGEFRSDKNQTLIAGLHPEGCSYQRLVDAPPLRLRYSEIQWPKGTAGSPPPPPPPPHSSQSSETSPPLHDLNDLHHLHNIGQRIRQSELARKNLDANPTLLRLYQKYIERRIVVRPGSRNSTLIALTTFLFRAVGKSRFLELTSAFHQINQDLFKDSLEQHMSEANAHFAACERQWFLSLGEMERQFVEFLPETHSAAFRICRDLAATVNPSTPLGQFFLSYDDLAARLGNFPVQAQRILGILEGEGWIKITEKGTRHTKGQPGRATRYQWSLEEADPSSSPQHP
jgi:hypothetical protein